MRFRFEVLETESILKIMNEKLNFMRTSDTQTISSKEIDLFAKYKIFSEKELDNLSIQLLKRTNIFLNYIPSYFLASLMGLLQYLARRENKS